MAQLKGAKGDPRPQGPKGDPGPQGPKGDPGATNVTVKTETVQVADGEAREHMVICPNGGAATGRGAHVGAGGGAGLAISRSEPLVVLGKPIGWDAIVVNTSGNATEFTTSAICAGP